MAVRLSAVKLAAKPAAQSPFRARLRFLHARRSKVLISPREDSMGFVRLCNPPPSPPPSEFAFRGSGLEKSGPSRATCRRFFVEDGVFCASRCLRRSPVNPLSPASCARVQPVLGSDSRRRAVGLFLGDGTPQPHCGVRRLASFVSGALSVSIV